MTVIGLTGQTGAGKSTVSEAMGECGLAVINADEISREAVKSGSACLKMLTKTFGCDIIKEDGSLDRKRLAERAFSSREKTELLNKITHPFILELTRQRISECSRLGFKAAVFDAPQLFESGGDKLCDLIVSVVADEKCRLERIISRDGISREQALRRMKAQLDEEYFKEHSDYIINGGQELESLISEAKALAARLLSDGG